MQTVAILGGGYGGIQSAITLSRFLDRRWHVYLFDRSPVHQLITRLPEVIGGTLPAERSAIPLKKILPSRVRFLQCDVQGIDVGRRDVSTSIGTIHADYIVLALGSAPDHDRIPGSDAHSWPVKSVSDAARLNSRLQKLCAAQAQTRVVIVGGGYTATEVAGELAQWNVRGGRPRLLVTIVNDEATLLHGDNERLASTVQDILQRKGVAIYPESPVSRVGPSEVVFARGDAVGADVIVWGAGSRAVVPEAAGNLRKSYEGRADVDPYLCAAPGIYVVGDSALARDFGTNNIVASSAQLAVQQGIVAAENIAAEIYARHARPFRPRVLGEAVGLGGRDGAAEVAGIVVTGAPALGVKKAALVRYLRRIGGVRLAARYA